MHVIITISMTGPKSSTCSTISEQNSSSVYIFLDHNRHSSALTFGVLCGVLAKCGDAGLLTGRVTLGLLGIYLCVVVVSGS